MPKGILMMSKKKTNNTINGILLIYHHPITKDASTIMEHVNAFENNSKFKFWKINTEFGFPVALKGVQFSIILLHYSLFGSYPFKLNNHIVNYLKTSNNTYKIAFFQDEYQFCPERFALINELHIDTIFTLIEQYFVNLTYKKYTNVKDVITCIPGYVSENLIKKSRKYVQPINKRIIDIGYRGRQLPAYMGKGAFEKTDIAANFINYTKKLPLTLDIDTHESARLYGDKWYEFLGKCKGMIGVEAGVTIFDLNGIIYKSYQKLNKKTKNITYEELSKEVNLNDYENLIPYRCISPRHFEASAFKICQILFEGNYSGILQPMIHYIPLKKDFSNFNEVVNLFQNDEFREKITKKSYDDLILSDDYSYKKFIEKFDKLLIEKGFNPEISEKEYFAIQKNLSRDFYKRVLLKLPDFCYQLLLNLSFSYKEKNPETYKKAERVFNTIKHLFYVLFVNRKPN